jgi:hypothetical protein
MPQSHGAEVQVCLPNRAIHLHCSHRPHMFTQQCSTFHETLPCSFKNAEDSMFTQPCSIFHVRSTMCNFPCAL